jgi:hypothetical protein
MGTRSVIAVEAANGSVIAASVHWDGYPAGVGLTLCDHYATASKARAVIGLGRISSLEATRADTLARMIKRDGGERIKYSPMEFATRAEFIAAIVDGSIDAEYAYLYQVNPFPGRSRGDWFNMDLMHCTPAGECTQVHGLDRIARKAKADQDAANERRRMTSLPAIPRLGVPAL